MSEKVFFYNFFYKATQQELKLIEREPMRSEAEALGKGCSKKHTQHKRSLGASCRATEPPGDSITTPCPPQARNFGEK